jgi:hypothetical protein
MTTKTRSIKWTKSCAGGSRFVFLRSCKLTELAFGGYMVERVTDRMPTSEVGYFAELSAALTAIDAEPEATCFGCGKQVVPGYQWPDLNCPDEQH